MKPIKAVVFDLDGTLVDTFAIYGRIYSVLFEAHFGRRLSIGEVFALGATAEIQTIRKVVGEADTGAYLERFCREYERELERCSALVYPGVPELIHSCRRRGVRLGIYTNKIRATAELTLVRMPFARAFSSLVTASHVQFLKPHPEGIQRAMKTLGASAQETLYVGDWPVDIATGRAAGVRTGLAAWQPERLPLPADTSLPDLIFTRTEELIGLLERGEERQDGAR